ncbi:type II secretion system protein GspM [Stenotrophomonas sp. 278]|uniref:type II secretion system protein GspM n=1 Tax=Stenotrophomonas sp. 278 TaxID=2479851 RepID=UPI000F65E0BD|nr:type II secretion system protein GspM [Stenotrophomonas sp. 278]RRT96820.1 type II secretion system protein M [Stenotrophomonas sp. 278]
MSVAPPSESRLRTWWSQRDRREQQLLAVMTVMVAAFALWFGLYRPLDRMSNLAAGQRTQAAAQLYATRTAATSLRDLRERHARPGTVDELRALVLESAVSSGLTLSREHHDPQSGVDIEVESAQPAQLFAWLDTLRYSHGLAPDELSVVRNNTGVRVQARFLP